MGNANVVEGGEASDQESNGPTDGAAIRFQSRSTLENQGRNRTEVMENSPPQSPHRSRSPILFAPPVPVAPLQRASELRPPIDRHWMNDRYDSDQSQGRPLPVLITWSFGGNDVAVEGSWDNWTSRTPLMKSGKDHVILLVLPCGIYQYKFYVDGDWKYIPDLPFVPDDMGHVNNLLTVQEHVPECFENVAEFEAPPSPDSSYTQPFPVMEDFAKDPPLAPSHLHFTVLGMPNPVDESTRPHHIVLNHLYIEKGWSSQSLVALGLTQRFQEKYVTVVLYKPLRR